MGRLLRGLFKLGIFGGIAGGVVVGARKLMGGLGPQPGAPDAPKEWPSLVPDPDAPGGNGQGEPELGLGVTSALDETRPTSAGTPHEAAAPAPSELAGGLADAAGSPVTDTDETGDTGDTDDTDAARSPVTDTGEAGEPGEAITEAAIDIDPDLDVATSAPEAVRES